MALRGNRTRQKIVTRTGALTVKMGWDIVPPLKLIHIPTVADSLIFLRGQPAVHEVARFPI